MTNEKVIGNETPNTPKKSNKKLIIIAVVVVVLAIAVVVGFGMFGKKEEPPKVVNVSTITEIINIDELSTFKTTYKGIATAYNESKYEILRTVKYHVAYEATVNVGLDLSKVYINLDEENKQVLIKLPDVKINNIDVDMDTMELMFRKDKYDILSVRGEAYSLCKADVEREASTQEAIFSLAQQNAVNIITALTKPVVQQMDPTYNVVVQ